MDVLIKRLSNNEVVPYDLLLLADPSREKIDQYINRGVCNIALVDAEEVGVFVLLRTQPETIEIVNIAVREDYQGKGIGKQLVLAAIKKAQEEQIKIIEIGTGNSSLNQLALYQKCGFRIVGIDQDFFVRNYDEEIFENGIQCRDMIRLKIEL